MIINNAGKIFGLYRYMCVRKGRQPADVFRILLTSKGITLHTTVSIDKYGFESAFLISIKKIAEWKGFSRDAKTLMFKARDKYMI